jgi:hypothetical protein
MGRRKDLEGSQTDEVEAGPVVWIEKQDRGKSCRVTGKLKEGTKEIKGTGGGESGTV